MKKNILNILNNLGVNKAIAYTVISKVIQAGGGIATLMFVANNLNTIEQGYYYTFGSILAIQIFFELGLSNIITQFVAHENAYLIWNGEYSFSGSIESSSRLSSLLRFAIKWFTVIAILLFFGLLLAGYLFFYKFGKIDDMVNWQKPWIILSITTSLSLMISPILAFFEGLGKVEEVAKIRLIQQIVQLSLLLSFFSIGFKLFSSPLAALISFFIILLWIFSGVNKEILIFIWHKIDKYHVNYKKEIFPFQWKIALSWISGYFIFQLFNPVLFATEGAIVAGQMGMTLAVLNAILLFTLSWINTKAPIFSRLIAMKNFKELDLLFNKTLRQSSYLNIIFLLIFFLMIFVLRYFNLKFGNKNIGERFLDYLPLTAMIIPIFLNHLISSWAIYLRCHKKEPMLFQSLITGLLCSISTIFLGKYFGVLGMTLGYMFVSILGFFWTYFIFKTKQKQWHYE